jgi:hypothetical protein
VLGGHQVRDPLQRSAGRAQPRQQVFDGVLRQEPISQSRMSRVVALTVEDKAPRCRSKWFFGQGA